MTSLISGSCDIQELKVFFMLIFLQTHRFKNNASVQRMCVVPQGQGPSDGKYTGLTSGSCNSSQPVWCPPSHRGLAQEAGTLLYGQVSMVHGTATVARACALIPRAICKEAVTHAPQPPAALRRHLHSCEHCLPRLTPHPMTSPRTHLVCFCIPQQLTVRT